jgi:hypothetical protein
MAEPNLERVKPPFQRSAESERLHSELEPRAIGEILSYEQIWKLIGEDPQSGAGYAIVKGVRDRLVKEQNAVWFVLPGIGLKRAGPQEMLEIIDAGLVSVRRKNQRNGRVVRAVDYDALGPEEKREFNFLSTIVGTLQLFFNPKARRLVREEVAKQKAVIDSTKVLGLFR